MLHPRTRQPAGLTAPLEHVWDILVASDPGLLRLTMAARGTASVTLMTLAAAAIGSLVGAPTIELASGIVFSLMAPFLMREPTRPQRQRTLLLLAIPTAAATLATTLLHGRGTIGDGFFLVIVFLGFLFQARSPRGIGLGLCAVVTSYIGLYLELPPATLPIQLLSIAAAIPVTAFCCFVLLPIRPHTVLHRTVQAVQRRAERVLRDAQRSTPRLRRSLHLLNEAALAADDQLARFAPGLAAQPRQHLIELELATAQLASSPAEAATIQRHIATAAAALGQSALIHETPIIPPPPPPGPFAWRVAARVTLASALAMAGGMALSPNRWFWAVITTYVVFLNSRSRGDTIYRGFQRLGGTLLGLAVGLFLATLLRGEPWGKLAVLLTAVFGMYYFFLVSYTLGIFFVTILLGLLYSLLGAPLEPLLLLRFEETAIGAAAAILVELFVLPNPTRDQVRRSGIALLRTLADAVAACRRALDGEPGTTPITAMRAVDRQVADLRLAMIPLLAGRLTLRRANVERPASALLDCVQWTRTLAATVRADDPAAAARLRPIEHRLDALARGERCLPSTSPDPTPDPIGNLDQATLLLAERLAVGALQAYSLKP